MKKKYYFNICLVIILTIITSFFLTYPLSIIKDLIDSIDLNNGLNVATEFLKVTLLYVVCILLSNILGSFNNYLINKIIIFKFEELRNETFNHLLHLEQNFFDHANSSDILGIVMQDTEKVAFGTINPIASFIKALFGFGFGIYFMIRISWIITVSIVPIVFIIGIITAINSKKMRTFAKNGRRKNTITWKYCTQSTLGIREIHSNNKELYVYNEFAKLSQQMQKNDLQSMKYKFKIESINSVFIVVLISVIVIISFFLIIQYKLSTGSFVTLLTYNSLLVNPVTFLVSIFQDISMKKASQERINIIINEKVSNIYANFQEKLVIKSNDIIFEHVNFSYSKNYPVLKDVTFRINKNQFVAFVGDTGGGKSTILKLIDGIYRPTSGNIFIFGNLISDLNTVAIRDTISFCFQETFILDGTIYDNLLFSNASATEDELKQAIKCSLLDQVLTKLPDGLNTMVGERGLLLSGGERQRVGIARLLLKKADILILDEATSALDNETEAQVINLIQENYKSKTIIVIAHKLSSVVKADNIFYISHGELIESGTHDALMSYDSNYKKLYEKMLN